MSDSENQQWLYVKDIAALAGIAPKDFRTRVSRGYAPRPDDDGSRLAQPDGTFIDVPPQRRMPRWRADGAIVQWLASLPARDASKSSGQ